MSLHQNEEYLENKLDMVRAACETGDIETAEAIVADVEAEGFDATALREEILETPIYYFVAHWAAQN